MMLNSTICCYIIAYVLLKKYIVSGFNVMFEEKNLSYIQFMPLFKKSIVN